MTTTKTTSALRSEAEQQIEHYDAEMRTAARMHQEQLDAVKAEWATRRTKINDNRDTTIQTAKDNYEDTLERISGGDPHPHQVRKIPSLDARLVKRDTGGMYGRAAYGHLIKSGKSKEEKEEEKKRRLQQEKDDRAEAKRTRDARIKAAQEFGARLTREADEWQTKEIEKVGRAFVLEMQELESARERSVRRKSDGVSPLPRQDSFDDPEGITSPSTAVPPTFDMAATDGDPATFEDFQLVPCATELDRLEIPSDQGAAGAETSAVDQVEKEKTGGENVRFFIPTEDGFVVPSAASDSEGEKGLEVSLEEWDMIAMDDANVHQPESAPRSFL